MGEPPHLSKDTRGKKKFLLFKNSQVKIKSQKNEHMTENGMLILLLNIFYDEKKEDY
jgi:hypothetical protein